MRSTSSIRQLTALLLCWFGWLTMAKSAEPHWAYVAPKQHRLPAVKNHSWPRNAIDFFVLRQLEDKGLQPSRQASRTTLIRRVTLDLTGLPPTPAEVSAFLRDKSPNAYERVVDRLLRSPAYAERMTTWWLDMARYADTHGYESDGSRNIWLYRDWVIDAFARGMPFDRFTIEQLAGDLLPSATPSQRVATGFHRNSPFCYEGGTDLEQFRVESVVDRVNTTMTVWMGTTFGCAQCHDHKYDPFQQKEYFQFYAFFNNTNETRGASFSAVSPLQTGQLAAVRSRIERLRQKRKTVDVTRVVQEWSRRIQSAQLRLLAPKRLVSSGGATLTVLKDKSILASGKNPSHDTYELLYDWPGGSVSALGMEVLHHKSLPKGGPGRYESNGNFGLSKIDIDYALPSQSPSWKRLKVKTATATHHDSNDKITNSLRNNRECWCTNQKEADAWFVLDRQYDLPAGTKLRIRMTHRSKWQRHGIGRFRLWSAVLDKLRVAKNASPRLSALASLLKRKGVAKNTGIKEFNEYLRSIDPALIKLQGEISLLRKMIPTAKTMVMQEMPKPRTTRILIAGSHLNPGKVVQPKTPKALHKWNSKFPLNRRGLAMWLMDPANPLVARVTMNRIWRIHLGRGIVKTSEDFGTQGSAPSHLQLLDHLATTFVRSGWNLQAMQRTIVTSATYRQSSSISSVALRVDPTNQFYSRGPAHRMDAEMIRDNALAVSGLLHQRLGGPGIYPQQPAGVYEQIHSYTTKWNVSSAGQQHRRGLYIWWKRTAPYPSMITFDAPRRNVCTERRPRTNTPLQALVSLNDPVFIECANALGRRMITETPQGTLAAKVSYGFRLCVARLPSDQETRELVKLYERALAIYRKKPKAAQALATAKALPSNTTAAEVAAWTLVANVLLNLDETLTKN